MSNHYLSQPLAQYVKGATHVQIRCTSPQHCGRSATMLTADLVAKLPRALTVRDFQERMKCQKCGCRGWASIEPARRG
jgi:hypothetical protein